MSERILRWFGDRRTETVIEMTHRHLGLTTEAVRQLHEMVRTASDEQKKKDFYETISQQEMRADEVRREMVTELRLVLPGRSPAVMVGTVRGISFDSTIRGSRLNGGLE